MPTYLIGYDLDKPAQDYEDLIAKLKSYGSWWHCLDSTWLIKTDKTHVVVRDELKALMGANDKLLVINVTGRERAWTGFAQRCADWLRRQDF